MGFQHGRRVLPHGHVRRRVVPPSGEQVMITYNVYWAPEGRVIATVQARSMRAAKRMAPAPYRAYLGELYCIPVVMEGV